MFTKADYLHYAELPAEKERDMMCGLAAGQRRYTREHAPGQAKLRNLETGDMPACRFLDISLGGAVRSAAGRMPQGLLLAVEMRFYEAPEATHAGAAICEDD